MKLTDEELKGVQDALDKIHSIQATNILDFKETMALFGIESQIRQDVAKGMLTHPSYSVFIDLFEYYVNGKKQEKSS